MWIRPSTTWQLPEAAATPESVFMDRRRLLRGLGLASAGLLLARKGAADTAPPAPAAAGSAPAAGEPAAGYPAPRNPAFELDRALTLEEVAAKHNVFDEMTGPRNEVWKVAQGLTLRPWAVHIGGQVEKPLTLDVEELVRRLGLEERLYRHRCVETWAMAVPWTGFPLRKLVELAKPLSKAKYLRMISFARPSEAPGWYSSRRVFPYYEALSLAEATHDLAFLATGIYGHPLPAQHGAPLRLAVPWKYGLKSLKSIVAFQLTENRPGTFWNDLSPGNYSWESNVDPTATHPWSQAEETMLGTDEIRPTQPYNGYAALVAPLYASS